VSRTPADEVADVSLYVIGMTVPEAEAAGYKVRRTWNGEPGLLKHEAAEVHRRRAADAEQSVRRWSATLTAQRDYIADLARTVRDAYREAAAGRTDAMAHSRAVDAAQAARAKYVRQHPPVAIGLPESYADQPEPIHGEPPAPEEWPGHWAGVTVGRDD
jgi:hypothetical protein